MNSPLFFILRRKVPWIASSVTPDLNKFGKAFVISLGVDIVVAVNGTDYYENTATTAWNPGVMNLHRTHTFKATATTREATVLTIV